MLPAQLQRSRKLRLVLETEIDSVSYSLCLESLALDGIYKIYRIYLVHPENLEILSLFDCELLRQSSSPDFELAGLHDGLIISTDKRQILTAQLER